MLEIVLFIVVLAATGYLAWRGYSRVWRNIHLGQPEKANDRPAERWRNLLLVALGQKKMFKKPIPAVLHLFLYVAFVITQIELLEIIVDGLFGQHRFFAAPLGGFYTFIISFIEILSVLALAGTIAFLYRRNAQRVPRLRPERHEELRGWPVRDANLILLAETVLIIAIFSMNGADTVLQTRGVEHYGPTGRFAVSGWLGPALFDSLGDPALVTIERLGWWLHILVVFGFLVYLPYSKHLHILIAFPNTYFSRLRPQGEMLNMPDIQREVRAMLGLPPLPVSPQGGGAGAEVAVSGAAEDPGAAQALPEFGASDVFQLSWVNVLHAYSCTECGRCTAACPANITGKKLSPRKIMMDVRDRAEEIGRNLASGKHTRENYNDGKNLFDYITREELHACTTCQACVEACPVLIHPLEIILKLRRYEILTESAGPAEWLPLFNAIENNGAAWAMSTDRDAWAR